MTDNDIHVIGFIDQFHIDLRNLQTKTNPDNIVKGYFHSMFGLVGQPIQKTIGNFIKISYITHSEISNDGFFYLECLVNDSRGMPSQFIKDNQEFEVIFNGKRYEYKNLKQLYIDYVNYETATTIDSLP